MWRLVEKSRSLFLPTVAKSTMETELYRHASKVAIIERVLQAYRFRKDVNVERRE